MDARKNLVDSETALAELIDAGHTLVNETSQADVIIVNTCGFIESARQESLNAIFDALYVKQTGKCKAVIAMGCLSQKFAGDLAQEIPDLDAIIGVSHIGSLAQTVKKALGHKQIISTDKPAKKWVEASGRVLSTPPWTAYLRISDGCNNRCAYCAIPDIRGDYRSRPTELVIEEAKRLAQSGVKEIILIGQDLTQFGEDLENTDNLPSLLTELNKIEGLKWIRLMYCYPTKVTDELIDVIAKSEKVVKYIDMPLQHADDKVLAAMNRKGTSADYLKTIDKIRAKMPDAAIRTTFIVGFPGEDEIAYNNLRDFIEQVRFDKVGVFCYSKEIGTKAEKLKPKVPKKIANARFHELMQIQQAISLAKNKEFIGKELEVLVEGNTEDGMFGRTYRDAPEIDGLVMLPKDIAKPGDFIKIKITEAAEYDLAAF